MKDHYATLGVCPDADQVVVAAAFKALMMKYHPDKNRSSSAQRHAAEINEACAIIGKPKKRHEYDRERALGTVRQSSNHASDQAQENSASEPPNMSFVHTAPNGDYPHQGKGFGSTSFAIMMVIMLLGLLAIANMR